MIKISFGIAIVLSLISPNYIVWLIPAVIFCWIFVSHKEKVIVSAIIISYLSSISEYFGDLRIYITLTASILLFYLFLKRFGLRYTYYPKVPDGIVIFLLSLLFCLFLSSIFSTNYRTGLFTILTMVGFFIICYLFYSLLVEKRNIYIYIFSLYVVAIILSVRMFVDLFRFGFETYAMRVVLKEQIELYSSSGYTGTTVFFVSITFLVAMLILHNHKKIVSKTLLFLLIILNIAIIIFANSRGGLLAGILSICFIFIVFNRGALIRSFFLICTLIVILFFTFPVIEESVVIYLRLETFSARELFWQAGIDIFKDFPITGVGPNLFPVFFSTYAPSGTYDYYGIARLATPTPHNIFLHFAAENGILGLAITISFFILFFYYASKTMKLAKKISIEYFILSSAITGIGIGLFIRSFIEVTGFLYYGYITYDLPFWLVFGILISIYQRVNFKVANI